MADKIKIFPLVVLAALIVMGLILYFVARRARETAPDPGAVPTETRPAPPPPTRSPVQAPPVSNDPGEKILEGADGAFRSGMFETALKFYKDFELRYAGTEVYDRHITKVWERIHTCGASMKNKDETLPAYLEVRRKAAEEWKRLRPLLAAAPTAETRPQLEKFEESLPPLDGRRKIIDAWLAPPGDQK